MEGLPRPLQRGRGGRATGAEAWRAISTARLSGSPRVHLPPIDVLVSDGPVRPHLAEGFALRCAQRLSRPDVATQRCAWRHNWRTRGRSGTVLSY